MIKKLLIILLCLLNTLTYASFPTTENSKSDISNTINFQIDDEEDEPSLLVYVLRGIFFSILGFGLYFLIRAWRRAWRDDIRWVKILTYISLAALLLYLLLGVFLLSIGYGYGN